MNCGCGCCEVSLLAWWAESSGESSCGACVAWFPVEVAECGKFSSQSLSDVRFSSHLFCFPARLHGEWKQSWDFLLMRCIPHSTRTSLNGATAQGPRLQYASALNLHPSKLKQDGAMAQLDYRFTFIDVAAWSANACSSQSATPPELSSCLARWDPPSFVADIGLDPSKTSFRLKKILEGKQSNSQVECPLRPRYESLPPRLLDASCVSTFSASSARLMCTLASRVGFADSPRKPKDACSIVPC